MGPGVWNLVFKAPDFYDEFQYVDRNIERFCFVFATFICSV
jgi:hypothetical protein